MTQVNSPFFASTIRSAKTSKLVAPVSTATKLDPLYMPRPSLAATAS